MTKIPPYSPEELTVVGVVPGYGNNKDVDILSYPCNNREAMVALYEHRPVFQPVGIETVLFLPSILPENKARAMIMENAPFNPMEDGGGEDMFGVKWVFEPAARGSMEDPNEPPILEDANDWREVIKFPDVDSWDWEGSAELNKGTFLKPENFNMYWIMTGWFERLISFMGFEEAIVAMIDEDQQDALKDLYMALTDTYIDIIQHVIDYYEYIDIVCVHDDWGSSLDAFFSPELCAELIVPAMKKFTDFLHSKGLYADLHSCGKNGKQVPNMIAAGWDSWTPQLMNDIDAIYKEYGDKIIISPVPQISFTDEDSEELQRESARAYAEAYCKPDAPTFFPQVYCGHMLTKAFREELYIQSRKAYYTGE